ncbi:metallopeptidase TldD-related protein [Aquipuribacter nitratireducens]|uniref:Metallopeptidase TldD-related protein n=1 Tax=Aquipuribacter nitratireducens TaxID=650104 RepID=A0ABW0GKJ7_9MICO
MSVHPDPGVEQVVDVALAAARRLGCDDAVVVVTDEGSTNLRWAANEQTTGGTTSERSASVAVVRDVAGGRAVGSLTRAVASRDDVERLVADAVRELDGAEAAEDGAALVVGPVHDDFAEAAPPVTPEALAGTARTLGELFARARGEDRELFGFAEHTVTTTWTATSAGTRHRVVEPYGTVELNGKSHARSRSAWAGAGARDVGAHVDLHALDAEVRQGLTWQARRVDVAPGRHDVVLPPSATADLLGYWLLSAEARAAAEGRSAFSRPGGRTRVGERLTPQPLTVRDDPAHPVLATSDVVSATSTDEVASVFDSGLAVPGTRYLDEGVLRALPSTRHTAALADVPVAPWAGNVLVDVTGGAGGTTDLLAGLGDGLLLTCLWYVRTVDEQTLLLTGLTRDGVYVVRGGEVVGATTNFRFNDSPAAMLSRVAGAGASQVCLARELGDWLPRTAAPALHVRDFHLSSVSEAS